MKLVSGKARIKNNYIRVPSNVLRYLKIKDNQPLSVFIEGDFIVIGKAYAHCEVCNEETNLIVFKNFTLCTDCIKAFYELAREYEEKKDEELEEKLKQTFDKIGNLEDLL